MNWKKWNKPGKVTVVCLLLFLPAFLSVSPTSTFAEPEVQLEVPESVLILGDQLVFRLTVNGAQSGVQLILPEIDGLQLRQIGTPMSSSRTVIINGKIDRFSGLEYNIAIRAQKAGNYRVPPIKIHHQSKVYHTNPFSLKVMVPGQQSAMKLDLVATKTEIFPQEPTIIILKWSIQERIEDYEFHFPLLDQKNDLQLRLAENVNTSTATKLRVSDYNIPFNRSNETIGNEPYTIYSAKFEIFIPNSGTFTIPAASVTAQVRKGSRISTNFFGERVRVPKMEKIFAMSQPLTIQVHDLPNRNRPKSFNGAIGDYKIELLCETKRAKVGDPINITIRISGKGRLDKLQAPLLSEIPAYRDQFTINDNLQPGDIQGDSVSFQQVIRPKQTSITKIPVIPFSFFDIKKKDYVTITSNTLPLKVLPTKKVSQSDVMIFDKRDRAAIQQYTKAKRGLQGNYTFEDVLQTRVQHWSWMLLIAFPPLLYVFLLLLCKHRQNLRENQALLRSKSAKAIKNKRLMLLRKRIENGDFYQEVGTTVSEFLSNKLNLGSGELTADDVRKLGYSGKIPAEIGKQIGARLEECDRYRFSGHQSTRAEKEEAYHSIFTLLKKLESKI